MFKNIFCYKINLITYSYPTPKLEEDTKLLLNSACDNIIKQDLNRQIQTYEQILGVIHTRYLDRQTEEQIDRNKQIFDKNMIKKQNVCQKYCLEGCKYTETELEEN